MKNKCCSCGKDIVVKRCNFKESGNYCAPCWWKAWIRPPQKKLGSYKECLVCGISFYVLLCNIDKIKCCSMKCSGISKRKSYKCSFCGKQFVSPSSGKKAKYCSRKCSSQSRCNGEIKKCAICDKDIYVIHCKNTGRKLHFCSRDHQNIWQSRNKKSHTCCTCGKEFLESPSIKRKYCSSQCRYDNEEERQRLIKFNLELQKGKPTKLEIAGYSLLDELGIKYEPQYLIANKFCVDAFVSDINLVIQFDGDYWHGNPSKYKTLDDRQRKRKNLDISQDAYLAKCGFKVLRIWESDMKSSIEFVREQLEGITEPECST